MEKREDWEGVRGKGLKREIVNQAITTTMKP